MPRFLEICTKFTWDWTLNSFNIYGNSFWYLQFQIKYQMGSCRTSCVWLVITLNILLSVAIKCKCSSENIRLKLRFSLILQMTVKLHISLNYLELQLSHSLIKRLISRTLVLLSLMDGSRSSNITVWTMWQSEWAMFPMNTCIWTLGAPLTTLLEKTFRAVNLQKLVYLLLWEELSVIRLIYFQFSLCFLRCDGSAFCICCHTYRLLQRFSIQFFLYLWNYKHKSTIFFFYILSWWWYFVTTKEMLVMQKLI